MAINVIVQTVVVVVVVILFILGVRLVDAPAEVTQEEGHTEFLHLPSAVPALIFIARKIQPSLSLVDREVEYNGGFLPDITDILLALCYYLRGTRLIAMKRFCMVRHIQQEYGMDQPGMVANPARGQLNRKNGYCPVRVRA